jgi:hypothetical protein
VSENLGGIVFMGICGYVAMLVPVLIFRSPRRSLSASFRWQFSIAFGLAALLTIGAGLQSPEGYPIILVPVSFAFALLAAHLTIRPIAKAGLDHG